MEVTVLPSLKTAKVGKNAKHLAKNEVLAADYYDKVIKENDCSLFVYFASGQVVQHAVQKGLKRQRLSKRALSYSLEKACREARRDEVPDAWLDVLRTDFHEQREHHIEVAEKLFALIQGRKRRR